MSLLYQTIMNNQSNHNTHLNKCAFKKVMIAEQEVEDAGIASNFSFSLAVSTINLLFNSICGYNAWSNK